MTSEERAIKLRSDIYACGANDINLDLILAYADEIRRECADRLNHCESRTVHVMDGPEDDWYSYKSIRLNDAIAAIMGKEACNTCGRQCPNDCPMDKEAGE